MLISVIRNIGFKKFIKLEENLKVLWYINLRHALLLSPSIVYSDVNL